MPALRLPMTQAQSGVSRGRVVGVGLRGRLRVGPAVPCPQHPGSRVQGNGMLTTTTGARHRYRCWPVTGVAHGFSVLTGEQGQQLPTVALQARAWTVPPSCEIHADEAHEVIRYGRYGTSTPQPRQRYRCTRRPVEADGSPVLDDQGKRVLLRHVFTPALPRDHVHPASGGCAECEELRGTHHGETAVARRHSWPTRTVAQALMDLSLGVSYADVSRWALRTAAAAAERVAELVAAGIPTAEAVATVHTEVVAEAASVAEAAAPLPPDEREDEPKGNRRRKNARTAEANNAWHIAADWCEAFAPVVFEPVEARLRAAAVTDRARLDALRAAGEPMVQPQVLLLDDLPVYGRNNAQGGTSRRDGGFFLLVAAETFWGQPAADPMTAVDRSLKLRAIRAMPKSNAPAWRLLFDELGYAPDFIVADAGTGIARAIETHFDPALTTLVPSLWHVARAVRLALADTPGAQVMGPTGKGLRPELADHVSRFSRKGALVDLAAWHAWWDDLERLCADLGLPRDKIRTRRKNYEGPFATALRRLAAHPEVPVSTGGLEKVMGKRVEPLLAMRRTGFANIERTNRLFDLVIAREHGAFDDLSAVVTLLRKDAEAAVGVSGRAGWTVPLRAIADPRPEDGRYSSLRDAMLVVELAEQRGLT
jgi:hypothetical protein